MKEAVSFKVGDKVEWDEGYWEKRGVIKFVVPPGAQPPEEHSGQSRWVGRPHESYIVGDVLFVNRKQNAYSGHKKATKTFWPHASKLRLVG